MTYSKYVEHIAQQGERWDDLAFKYYGDSFSFLEIIKANPDIAISPFLPEGSIVKIPIFEDTQISDKTDLPIWKQLT